MTTQQAYEKARAYLTRPGARQAIFDNEDACMYEVVIGDEIHHCAVGCLLEPETLNQMVEVDKNFVDSSNHSEDAIGSMIQLRDFSGGLSGIWIAGYKTPELNDVDGEFLTKMQHLHDNAGNWDSRGFMVGKLDELAQQHGLSLVAG